MSLSPAVGTVRLLEIDDYYWLTGREEAGNVNRQVG